MSTTNLSIKYRPVKIGFLVEDDCIDDLVKVAGLNTLLWGGIYNPIIPISRNKLELAEQLADLFSVDALIPVSENETISTFMKEHEFLQLSRLFYPRSEQIFYTGPNTEKNLVLFLDSLAIVNYLQEKDARYKDKVDERNCALPRWDPEDTLNAVFSLEYGFFPTEYNLQNNFEDDFLKGLHPKELTIAKNATLDAKLAHSINPLSVTRKLLKIPYNAFSENGVFLGSRDNFEDLVIFWNLRAAGNILLFLPRNHLDRFQEITAAYLKQFDKSPQHHLTLHYRTATDGEIDVLHKKFFAKKQLVNNCCTDIMWNGSNIKPATFYFKREQTHASVERLQEEFKVYIQLPKMWFLADSDRESRVLLVAAEILPHGESIYSGHVLHVPRIRQLNEFYRAQMELGSWSLRVQNDGIAGIIGTRTKVLTLYPISNLTLIRQILDFASIEAELSQPGRLASKIIERLGGIEACRIFKIRGARKLLQSLKTDESLTRSAATDKIWADGEFEKYQNLYIEPRKIGTKLSKENVFDFLLKYGFFRGGLELECNDCKLYNWLPLRSIDDVWTCEYCGSKDLTSLHLRHRGDWKFRKSGLFAKGNNQEGAIPVLLTLLVFSRILGFGLSRFVWTTALKLQSPDCEIDFCVLSYSKDQIEIGIGECKSAGGEINHKDLDNLKGVRENLIAAGLDCYITLAKTKDSFTTEEIKLLSKADDENVPLILLTNQEMEQTYHPYWDDASEVPNKYPTTLLDMSINSKSRYLK